MTPEKILIYADWLDRCLMHEESRNEIAAFLRACAKCEPVYQVYNQKTDGWEDCVKPYFDTYGSEKRTLYTAPQAKGGMMTIVTKTFDDEQWQIVPKKATDTMTKAAHDCDNSYIKYGARDIYSAMLAAAPQPPEQKK